MPVMRFADVHLSLLWQYKSLDIIIINMYRAKQSI